MDCKKKQDQSKVAGVSNNLVEQLQRGSKSRSPLITNLSIQNAYFTKKTCFDVVISGGCQVVCTSGDLGMCAILVGGELPCLYS